MAEPIWNGFLRLSLVSCRVYLSPATTDRKRIALEPINRSTGNPLVPRLVDLRTGEVVAPEATVQAHPYGTGRQLRLSDAELQQAAGPPSQIIDIEEFIPLGTIDRLFFEQYHYVYPDEPLATDTLYTIRTAMLRQGQAGLGHMHLGGRQRRLLAEPRGDGLMITILRSADQVEAAEFERREEADVSLEMIEIAESIMARRTTAADPSRFRDAYDDALRALIAERTGVAPPAPTPPPAAATAPPPPVPQYTPAAAPEPAPAASPPPYAAAAPPAVAPEPDAAGFGMSAAADRAPKPETETETETESASLGFFGRGTTEPAYDEPEIPAPEPVAPSAFTTSHPAAEPEESPPTYAPYHWAGREETETPAYQPVAAAPAAESPAPAEAEGATHYAGIESEPAEAEPAAGAAEEPVEEGLGSEIFLHIIGLGERRFVGAGWAGTPGSRQPIEALSIRPREGLARNAIEFRVFARDGRATSWVTDGNYAGSWGRRLPLTGFAVRPTEDHGKDVEIVYEGYFSEGGVVGPKRDGEACTSPIADDPLEAVLVRIVERAA